MEPDTISPHIAAAKKVKLNFSFGYQLEDCEFILRMIASERIDTENLITRQVSLEDLPIAFEELLSPNSHCKIVVTPNTTH